MKKDIFEIFKKDIINQFIGVLTFGFAVTAFYLSVYNFILYNTINITFIDSIFLLISIIEYMIIYYNKDFKITVLKSIDFVITIFGFVLMFVPIILLFQALLSLQYNDMTFMIKRNIIICFSMTIILFYIKSVFKYYFKRFI